MVSEDRKRVEFLTGKFVVRIEPLFKGEIRIHFGDGTMECCAYGSEEWQKNDFQVFIQRLETERDTQLQSSRRNK